MRVRYTHTPLPKPTLNHIFVVGIGSDTTLLLLNTGTGHFSYTLASLYANLKSQRMETGEIFCKPGTSILKVRAVRAYSGMN